MAHTKEGKIEAAFCEAVEAAGGLVRKSMWVGRRGCPDRFYALPNGRHGFAEIKASGCKPDAHQDREIARLRAMGVAVWVIDSLEAIEKFMEANR